VGPQEIKRRIQEVVNSVNGMTTLPDDVFSNNFDTIDLLILITNCEAEFNIQINKHTKLIEDFETVKDFIDWVETLVVEQNGV
jgi:acyl carrier protein